MFVFAVYFLTVRTDAVFCSLQCMSKFNSVTNKYFYLHLKFEYFLFSFVYLNIA